MSNARQSTTDPDEPAPDDAHAPEDGGISPAPKQTANPDETVFRYATYYDRVRIVDDDSSVETARELLFQQLKGYRNFLSTRVDPSPEIQTWTPLQQTIFDASYQAEMYLNHHASEKIVDMIIEDMVEKQRNLPHGVAEWVVEQVSESGVSENEC